MKLFWVITICAVAFLAQRSISVATTTHPAPITSISVCGGSGTVAGSCPTGTFDTHQIVLAPDGSGNAINAYGPGATSDEHSSVFSPGMLGTNSDYLFFVASGTSVNPDIGMTVLSGGAGPGKNGQWTFDYAKSDTYGLFSGGYGTVFLAPTAQKSCPTVADGNPSHQDQTFDLNYAAAGSVVIDPTSFAGSLLAIYEGTNACFGNTGGANQSTGAYITLGLATSFDYGHNWPTYRGNTTFTFALLPTGNKTQGPSAPAGAMGSSVCIGNNCLLTPLVTYGRYAVLSPPTSLASLMVPGTPLSANIGDSEPSAFVDDASPISPPYLYAVYGSVGPAANGDLTLARTQLNGGTAPLGFNKWNGQSFNGPGAGGTDTPIFPAGPAANCEGSGQGRHSGSISYVDSTQQYLLLFVCTSANDPLSGAAGPGSSWFYSTSYDLTDPTQWSAPQEVIGSWSQWDSTGGCPSYKGWYPTLMSLGGKPGHLAASGYAFYMWGCEGGAGKRQFSSRAFTISTGTPVTTGPTLTQGTLANGATYISGGLVPGSWAQVKGTNLSSVTRNWTTSDFTGLGNNLPTSLNGVAVKVNGLSAAVFYVDPGQVTFQVPTGVSGTASVQVINNGAASNTVTATAVNSAPGVFPIIQKGTNYAAGVFLDGKIVGDASVSPAFRNAKPGDTVALYATGLMPTPAGVLPASQGVSGVTVTIGSVTVPADFAGLVAVGEFQINFTVPQQFASMAVGGYPITIQVNGVSSPATINSNPAGQIVLPIQH